MELAMEHGEGAKITSRKIYYVQSWNILSLVLFPVFHFIFAFFPLFISIRVKVWLSLSRYESPYIMQHIFSKCISTIFGV